MAAMARLAALACALALAACSGAGGVTVTHIAQDSLYAPQLLRPPAGRALPVIATGPGSQDRRWAEAASEALAAIGWLPFRDVQAAPRGAAGGFHIAVAVAAPLRTAAGDACAGAIDRAGPGAGDGRSHVIVALCHRQRPIASARAAVAAFSGPASPLLALAVQAAAVQAFPRRSPDIPGGHDIQLPVP